MIQFSSAVLELEYRALSDQGFAGMLPEKELLWLQSNGATSNVRPQAWAEMLASQGYTGPIQQAWDQFLASLGYTGTLKEKEYQFWLAGGMLGEDAPVWHAAVPDDTTYEMLAQKTGEGSPTFTTSEILLPDHEGVYRTIPVNTVPWHGSRRVANHIEDSDDLTAWDRIISATVNGPESVTLQTGNSFVEQNIRKLSLSGTQVVWSGLQSDVLPVSSSWQRVATEGLVNAGYDIVVSAEVKSDDLTSFQFVLNSSARDLQVRIRGNEDAGTLEIRNVQLEFKSGAPSEFVATSGLSIAEYEASYYANANGNTVTSNVVTEAVGTPLTEMPSLYAAPAMTNLYKYSNDVTQAPTWGNSNGNTIAFDQTGLTDDPNTASSITSTAADGYVSQPLAVAIADHTIVVRIKKGGSSFFPAIYVEGASSVWQINIDDGSMIAETGSITDNASELLGDWWTFYFQFNAGTGVGGIRLWPSRGTVFGVYDPNARGTITLGNCEIYEATIAEVRSAAPIVTEGSTVTNAAVEIVYDTANHSNAQGCYYAEYENFVSGFDRSNAYALRLEPSAVPLYPRDSGSMRCSSVGLIVNTTGDLTGFSGKEQMGCAWDAISGDLGARTSGTVWAEGTPYTSFGDSLTELRVLHQLTPYPQLMRNIQRWDLPYDDAKAKIDELMS